MPGILLFIPIFSQGNVNLMKESSILETYSHLRFKTHPVTKFADENHSGPQQAESQAVYTTDNIRNLVKQAPVGMCILKGSPLYVVEVNDLFLNIIARERQAFTAAPYWKTDPETRTIYECITRRVLETGTSYRSSAQEIRIMKAGKPATVYVDFLYEPMKDEKGRTYAIMIVAIDVTSEIVSRKELESAYEQIRLSKEAAQLGTFDIDVTSGEMEWDERCRSLFGISHSEPVTYEHDFIERLHPEDQERVTTLINALFEQRVNDGIYDVEYRTIDAEDGKVRWVRAKGKVFYDELAKPLRFIGSVLEITEQKQNEQRKNDFIGMVSHELKTPLTTLSAIIQLSKTKIVKKDESFLTTAMGKAEQQVKRMTSMINGFLDISRLESSKMHMEKTSFEMGALIREVIAEYKWSTSTHVIELSECEHVIIEGDRDKIMSVVSNLVSNAIKYAPKNDFIKVNCLVTDGLVQVSVADKGMGIKPQDIDHVFDRYYRIESKHTQHIAGFGIGLYLSAEIVRQHRGKIWVESQSGVGSTFYFTLPLK
jgi:two-component system sensor histidine kinase VicK